MQHCHRPFLLAALVVLGAASAGAQTSAAPPANATPVSKPGDKATGRPDPSIERIRTQDAGSRIDELRVGGETQSITVQPAADMPAYEVRPMDASRNGSGTGSDKGSAGARFWNILKF